jgi:hypothetical protein
MIRNVTVYCSSSSRIAPVYTDAARELGHAIATRGWRLVYGGNYIGAMGALADGARAAGGCVTGITPRHFLDQGYGDHLCDELVVCKDMRERKQFLEERGDAFIALPGGLGTLEEIIEVIAGKSLGFHAKPIVLLNIDGFYQPLLAMIEQGIEKAFIKPIARELYCVADTVAGAMELLQAVVT